MTLIHESRRPAPPFPLHLFNKAWATWLTDTAEGCGAPVDFVAEGLLTAASSLIGNSRWVSPWSGWSVPPLIWGALVGLPSSGKTPAAVPVKKFMTELEDGLGQDYPDALRAYQTASFKAKVEREQWEKTMRGLVKDSADTILIPEGALDPEFPVRRRLCADDATVEAIGLLLSKNPRGLYYAREELAGWFGAFDKYGGNGSDRAYWLETYDSGPRTIDRVKHQVPIKVPFNSVAVSGGIQPDRLAAVLSGPDDGLACRFNFYFAEAVPPKRPTRVANDGPARSAFRRLLDLEMATDGNGNPTPVVIHLSDEAADRFEIWRALNATREPEASGLLLSWLGKCPGFVLRHALVFEFLDWAIELPDQQPKKVSTGCVERAVNFVDNYLLPMAERTFGDALLPDDERYAAVLARLIYARRIGEQRAEGTVVNRRLIQRLKLPGLRTAARVGGAIEYLVEAGWLEAISSPRGGRRKGDYLVNPMVWNKEGE